MSKKLKGYDFCDGKVTKQALLSVAHGAKPLLQWCVVYSNGDAENLTTATVEKLILQYDARHSDEPTIEGVRRRARLRRGVLRTVTVE